MNELKKLPFGTLLRATRLCWEHVPQRCMFMRTSDDGPDCFLVELIPDTRTDLLKPGPSGRKYRIVEDAEAVIALSPVLRAIKRLKKPLQLKLDDNGELA